METYLFYNNVTHKDIKAVRAVNEEAAKYNMYDNYICQRYNLDEYGELTKDLIITIVDAMYDMCTFEQLEAMQRNNKDSVSSVIIDIVPPSDREDYESIHNDIVDIINEYMRGGEERE